MTTIADFYKQNDEAFALISKIRLPEDFNIKKEYYFDDLVMSNILSFIPKYRKKVERVEWFRVGVFEYISSYREFKNCESNVIIIVTKITPKTINYIEIDKIAMETRRRRKIRKDLYDREFVREFVEGEYLTISSIHLIRIRKETFDKILDKTWFDDDDDEKLETAVEKIHHYYHTT